MVGVERHDAQRARCRRVGCLDFHGRFSLGRGRVRRHEVRQGDGDLQRQADEGDDERGPAARPGAQDACRERGKRIPGTDGGELRDGKCSFELGRHAPAHEQARDCDRGEQPCERGGDATATGHVRVRNAHVRNLRAGCGRADCVLTFDGDHALSRCRVRSLCDPHTVAAFLARRACRRPFLRKNEGICKRARFRARGRFRCPAPDRSPAGFCPTGFADRISAFSSKTDGCVRYRRPNRREVLCVRWRRAGRV